MFIDELKNYKRGGRTKVTWVGYDIRYGNDKPAQAPENEQAVYDQLKELMNSGTVYNVVELAPLLAAEWGGKHFRFIQDCFNPMPPYPRTIFEQVGLGMRACVMLEQSPVTELVEVRRFYLKEEALKRTPRESIKLVDSSDANPLAEGVVLPEAKWFINVSVALKFNEQFTIFLDSPMAYFCDAKGQALTTLMNNRTFDLSYLVGEENQEEAYKQIMQIASNHFSFACMALNLMGCKNIGSEENVAGNAIQKKRARSGKEPITTYRTLTYSVPGKMSGKLPQKLIEHAGERRAFHTVPGMTRDYRENGLFGKFHDIFYFRAHTRGSKEAGEVVKDYKVTPGETSETNS